MNWHRLWPRRPRPLIDPHRGDQISPPSLWERAVDRLRRLKRCVRARWRIWRGLHPEYEWGATSEWSRIISMVNRTIWNYIKSEVAELESRRRKHTALKRFLGKNKVTFGEGPEIRWDINVKEGECRPAPDADKNSQ